MNRLRWVFSGAIFWVLCTPFVFIGWCFAWLSDIVEGDPGAKHQGGGDVQR